MEHVDTYKLTRGIYPTLLNSCDGLAFYSDLLGRLHTGPGGLSGSIWQFLATSTLKDMYPTSEE
jgi:hypothetical protein